MLKEGPLTYVQQHQLGPVLGGYKSGTSHRVACVDGKIGGR
jgi:hypothetical protein